MPDLIRHGPFASQTEATAFVRAGPRPQPWLAGQGARLQQKLETGEWCAFLPEDVKPEGEGVVIEPRATLRH